MDVKPFEIVDSIRQRLRYWKIKNLADSAWIEEFSVEDGKLDLLTLDLRLWTVRGFEVKISRSDFLSDRKWPNYLPYVNYFYFATPPGLIKPEELPPEIGLLEIGAEKPFERVKAQLLQPTFVRETHGERYMTRLLLKYLRDVAWRDRRNIGQCPDCGKQLKTMDGRMNAGYQRQETYHGV